MRDSREYEPGRRQLLRPSDEEKGCTEDTIPLEAFGHLTRDSGLACTGGTAEDIDAMVQCTRRPLGPFVDLF